MWVNVIPCWGLTALFGIIPWRGSVGIGFEYYDKGWPYASWLTVPPQLDLELMHTTSYFALGCVFILGSFDLPGSDYFLRYIVFGNYLPLAAVILITGLLSGPMRNASSLDLHEGATTAPPTFPLGLVEFHVFFVVPIADIYVLTTGALLLYLAKYYYDAEPSPYPDAEASMPALPPPEQGQCPPSFQLKIAMRVIGTVFALLLIAGYGIPLSGWRWICGDCQEYIGADHQWKYEPMIVAWGVGLGIFLVLGSWDLPGSKHLLNFAIWGEFFLHGIQMLIRTWWMWPKEVAHIYPWGSVSVRLLFGIVLLIFKLRHDASPEGKGERNVMRLPDGPDGP